MLCPTAWGYQRPRRHGRSSALILHERATSSQAGSSDSSRHQSGHVGAFLAYAEGHECLLHHAATLQPSDREVLSRTLSGCHRTTTRRQVLVLGAFVTEGWCTGMYGVGAVWMYAVCAVCAVWRYKPGVTMRGCCMAVQNEGRLDCMIACMELRCMRLYSL